MLVRMQLSLPRDARYVPILRNVADCMMRNFTIPDEAVHDIKVAITEACSNAVRHAAGVAEYSVYLQVSESACEVEVVDNGPGFAPTGPDGRPSDDAHLEDGRGIDLMRALVDELSFASVDDATRVRLVKRWPGVSLREPDALAT